MNLVMQVPI